MELPSCSRGYRTSFSGGPTVRADIVPAVELRNMADVNRVVARTTRCKIENVIHTEYMVCTYGM